MRDIIISVIIPVYNAAEYLAETLDSVFHQSFNDFELILINDGSTDGSEKIIKDYSDCYPDKVISIFQQNQGQSAARNNALDYARGKYIAFVDSDDIIAETYLEKLYDAAERENAQMSVCAFRAYDDATGKTVEIRMTEDWTVPFDSTHSHVFQYSPWARLIRTDFIRKYGLRFSVGEQMEDGPYCMMADILAEHTAIVNSIEYYYRLRGNSTTDHVIKSDIRPKVPYNGLVDAIKAVQANTEDKVSLQMLEYCSIKIMAGWVTRIYSNCNDEIRRDICDRCTEIVAKYFPEIGKNPYFSISRLIKIPLTHRAAVRLFVAAYRTKTLFAFSKVSAAVLRKN